MPALSSYMYEVNQRNRLLDISGSVGEAFDRAVLSPLSVTGGKMKIDEELHWLDTSRRQSVSARSNGTCLLYTDITVDECDERKCYKSLPPATLTDPLTTVLA